MARHHALTPSWGAGGPGRAYQGKAALFGFVGVPANQRLAVGQGAIITARVQQLADLFGPEAASPVATLFIWTNSDQPLARSVRGHLGQWTVLRRW
ncbi:hypothetical protein [Microvirga makkahensis]|uniref:hypothetical protein n=1 Tax=Microvirga makkahensis TaxID=1128670 RepID=UPI001FE4B530|nr:hypothetical protein [Microvirga makkahensis]